MDRSKCERRITQKESHGHRNPIWPADAPLSFRPGPNGYNSRPAVKVLPPAAAATHPERLRLFEQEARAAGAINHTNILSIFDVGIQDGAPYVVYELLEGETLRDRLRQGSLSRRKALEYARQIATGLAAAHDKAIAHRDLWAGSEAVGRAGLTRFSSMQYSRQAADSPEVIG